MNIKEKNIIAVDKVVIKTMMRISIMLEKNKSLPEKGAKKVRNVRKGKIIDDDRFAESTLDVLLKLC